MIFRLTLAMQERELKLSIAGGHLPAQTALPGEHRQMAITLRSWSQFAVGHGRRARRNHHFDTITVLRDLSAFRKLEQLKMERRMLEIEKFAATGRLAGTIAHELMCGVTQRVKFELADSGNETPALQAGVQA